MGPGSTAPGCCSVLLQKVKSGMGGMNRWIGLQAEQTSQQVFSFDGQRNFLDKNRPEHHNTAHLKENRVGKGSSPSEVESSLRSTKAALVLFLGQPLATTERLGLF